MDVYRYVRTALLTARVSWLLSWLSGLVVERRSLTGELSLVCTGPAADV